MTVAELIETLSKFDPASQVLVGSGEEVYGWKEIEEIAGEDVIKGQSPPHFFPVPHYCVGNPKGAEKTVVTIW